MAQNFFQQGAPVETGLVREYVSNLQTNTDTLRSNFSGSIFPSNPVVGQKCFRVDEQVEYTFIGDSWVQSAQLSAFAIDVINARGSLPSLYDRLNVAINPDGTLKNPIAAEIDEWKDTALSVAYVADNQFSVVGNLLPTFTKGRSLKIYNRNDDGEISVGGITSVVSSAVSGENTIVTVADSIITGDLYDVKYGLIQESVIPQRNSLQRSTAYDEKDIAYSDKLKSYMYLECIIGGTTGVTEPSYRTVVTPSDVGEATNVTQITTNGGTTGTVTSGGTFTGASNETIYVKLSTSTPSTVEPYDTVTLSYCVGSQTGTYTEVGLADGEPQEIVDGVTVQLGTTGVFEDGEIYSIACVAEVANEADIGDTVTDGTVTWTIRKIGSGGGEAVGVIKAFAGNGAIPSGYLLCDGAAVSRTMFPDLFAAIGTTYGAGDGSTTFNLPDYNTAERFAQGSTVAGTVKQAGLPNITGYTGDYPLRVLNLSSTTQNSGAFKRTNYAAFNNTTTVISNTSLPSLTGFDASLSNPIYGNSTTVQPNALTCRYIIKAFDGQTADSALIDITQYAQELAGKANITGSNLVHHRDVITTSGTYTAPVTGLYKITVKGGGGGGQGGGIYSAGHGGGEGGTTIAYEKMIAGQTASVVIGAGGSGGTATSSTFGNNGTNGGDTTVTIDGITYTGGGGGNTGLGGTGTIPGCSGGPTVYINTTATGQWFGGAGGGAGGATIAEMVSTKGGGGAGGECNKANYLNINGTAGGDGYCWFEFYTPGA